MEGKEFYKDEDDDLNSGSKKEDSDSDSFGLPEYESSEGDSPDDKKNEDDAYSYEDPYSSDSYASDSWEDDKKEGTDDYGYDKGDATETDDYGYTTSEFDDSGELPPLDTTEPEYKSTYYEDEYQRKKSPVGWIILIVALLVAAAVGIFWLLNRESKPKVVREQTPVQPKVTTPIVEEDTATADELANIPPLKTAEETSLSYQPASEGEVVEISESTNRYYVIVSSSIDDDLIMDYAKKLTAQGHTCKILDPRGNKKFHRLAIADYEALNDAALKSEELKAEFGQGVWVIRY